ncbi:hypothetical protein [Streptomyces sp. S465]|uniref:hypothetical protein n=1 Tax=Streptomyces sp. S465 TaxID=2979468 RepID=UPI0022A85E11|nr:hypothetical protein [Streptomyces sp. S465]WAP58885.1 hypothetical protein N6H00_30150 [Streptomyces sp. S465]
MGRQDRADHGSQLPRRPVPVHHLAYAVESIDRHLAALREAGEDPTIAFDGAIADRARFAYLDGLAHGPVVELIERAGQGG